MDVDLSKPVYVFLLDFSDITEPTNVSDLPKDFLSKCCHLHDTSSGKEKPAIAVRGSTPHFGCWGVEGLRATELKAGRYAFLVNDFIPKEAQYKWLNMNGVTITGDVDPATGYHYEPDPFIDRGVGDVGAVPGNIVFVFNTWGNYTRHIQKEPLEAWMTDITGDPASSEEKKEVDKPEGADETKLTSVGPGKETEDVSDVIKTSEPKPSSTTDTQVDKVSDHYDSSEIEIDDKGKQEVQTPEKETLDDHKKNSGLIGEADTNEHQIEEDKLSGSKDETVAFIPEKADQNIPTEKINGEATDEVKSEDDKIDKVSSEEMYKDSIDMASVGNDQMQSTETTSLPIDTEGDVVIEHCESSEIESDIKKTPEIETLDDIQQGNGTTDDSDLNENQINDDKLSISKDETMTFRSGKQVNENESLVLDDQPNIPTDQHNVEAKEDIDKKTSKDCIDMAVAVTEENEDKGETNVPEISESPEDDDTYKSKNGESFMASEEIEMTLTTTTAAIASPDDTAQDRDNVEDINEDTENNNPVLIQGKVIDTDDVYNHNEPLVEKIVTSTCENTTEVSEATFKRMSRISSSETPEVDQVIESIMGTELSQITVPNLQRLPSSSSC